MSFGADQPVKLRRPSRADGAAFRRVQHCLPLKPEWFYRQIVLAAAFVLTPLGGRCAAATNCSPATHLAVERGLGFLRQEAFKWKETRNCAACHHAMAMVWGFNEARAAGYAVDKQALCDATLWAFGDMKTNSLTEQAPPRNVLNLGWVYALLSVETAPEFKAHALGRDNRTNPQGSILGTNAAAIFAARDTLVRQIIAKQASDGSWGQPLDQRVPLGGPIEDIAILSRLALLQSGDHSASVANCIEKAGQWLAANQDKTSRQSRNLRLLMNSYEAKSGSKRRQAIETIRTEQNADGGWSQTPEMQSDAYATGQTLYVLARAGDKLSSPEILHGIAFLVKTQHEDGSWPMTSRVKAKNLNPIRATGTAWAVLGLTRASR